MVAEISKSGINVGREFSLSSADEFRFELIALLVFWDTGKFEKTAFKRFFISQRITEILE